METLRHIRFLLPCIQRKMKTEIHRNPRISSDVNQRRKPDRSFCPKRSILIADRLVKGGQQVDLRLIVKPAARQRQH